MFNLPQTTEFNKRVPKQKFYEHLPANAKIKKPVCRADKNNLLAQQNSGKHA